MKGYDKVLRERLWVKNVVAFEEVYEQRLNIIPKGESCKINFKIACIFCDKLFFGMV
jgi:hypothetical protein